MRTHTRLALFVSVVTLAWAGAARASDEDTAAKLCSILADLVADTKMSAEDAKTAFGTRLSEAFFDTPQVLGQLVRQGDKLATDACPAARTTFLERIGEPYLSHAMY